MSAEHTPDGTPITELSPPHVHGVTGRGQVCVDVADLCTFLTAAAILQSRVLCDPTECTECQRTCHIWWEHFVSLTQREARLLAGHFGREGIRLPWRPAIFLFLDPTLEWSE